MSQELVPASAGLLRPAGPVRPAPAERFFTPAALQRAWLAVKRAGGGPGVDQTNLTAFEAGGGAGVGAAPS
jgi:hypothetical protein